MADPPVLRTGLKALAASGGLAGLYGIVQHLGGRDWLRGELLEAVPGGGFMAVGTLDHHLTYAGVLLPVFFLAIGLAFDARPRALWIAAAACLGLGLLFSFARVAWAGAAVGLLVLGLLRGRRPFLLLLGGLTVGALVLVLASPAIQQRLIPLRDIEESTRSRLWRTSLRMVEDHPLLGAGVGSFGTLFPIYKVPGDYVSTAHPHNDLLNVMVETGAAGTLLWVGLWVVFFYETQPGPGRRLPSRRRGPWLPDALRASVAALLAGGMGQCFATDEEVAQVWWFLVAAALLLTRRPHGREGAVVDSRLGAGGGEEAGAGR
jgi:putative inorganic carbon (HCO3(-)) transporter